MTKLIQLHHQMADKSIHQYREIFVWQILDLATFSV